MPGVPREPEFSPLGLNRRGPASDKHRLAGATYQGEQVTNYASVRTEEKPRRVGNRRGFFRKARISPENTRFRIRMEPDIQPALQLSGDTQALSQETEISPGQSLG